ncbi:MAG: FKBP-type peptidyl-prolyl cis-trans isomerase [Planctomycetota bacterium]
MEQAKSGDTVKVHYTGKLDDGNVFDSSSNRDPMQFVIGQNQLIPDFEQAVVGMSPGESKTVEIASDRAFGGRREDLVTEIDSNSIPPELEPEVGQRLNATDPNGQTIAVTVVEVAESGVKVDANHPHGGGGPDF